MQRIPREKLTVLFDRHDEPVARVQPGERFVVECEDARGGRRRTAESTTREALLQMRKEGWYGNPVTGPIFIEGAMPGDTLAVTIHEQTVDTLGWIPVWPFLFRFEDLFDGPSTELVEIQGGFVHLRSGAKVPIKPMIGTIGTAPAMEAILSGG